MLTSSLPPPADLSRAAVLTSVADFLTAHRHVCPSTYLSYQGLTAAGTLLHTRLLTLGAVALRMHAAATRTAHLNPAVTLPTPTARVHELLEAWGIEVAEDPSADPSVLAVFADGGALRWDGSSIDTLMYAAPAGYWTSLPPLPGDVAEESEDALLDDAVWAQAEPWCACGRRTSQCDRSRRGCVQ